MAFNRDGIAIVGAKPQGQAQAKTYKHLIAGAPIEVTDQNNVRFQVSGLLDLAPIDVELPMAFFYGLVGPYLAEVAKAQGVNLNMRGA